MKISLIYGASQNGVIGLNNRLPWHLPADLKRFKAISMGHHVVMGRKTHESIGRPLPGRTNIVITRQQDFQAAGCLVAHSLEEALGLCQDDNEVFIIGGAEIYRLALARADRIYLTLIHQDFAGDIFIFELEPTVWREIAREDCLPDEKNKFYYSFLILERVGLQD